MSPNPTTIITWVLAVVVPIATAVVLSGILTLVPGDLLMEVVRSHFAAIVGLPFAAVFSAFLVVVLQQASGPIKFEGLGFKFEGTSGQVVLWIVCFVAFALAIKLVWNP